MSIVLFYTKFCLKTASNHNCKVCIWFLGVTYKTRMRDRIKEFVTCHLPMLCVWTHQTLFATVCLLVCASPTLHCSPCVLTLLVDTFNKAQCASTASACWAHTEAELCIWYYIEKYLVWCTIWSYILIVAHWCTTRAQKHCIVRRKRRLSVLCTDGIRSPTEIAEQRERGRNLEKHATATQ